jgi:hypothetical protein
MSAAGALELAQAAGVTVTTDGNALVLQSEVPPSPIVLDALARHKPAIMALLRVANRWVAEDWQAFFHERAGIAEFDGGLSRPQAEARAFACCVVEWLSRNPIRSGPECCVACGSSQTAQFPLLPFSEAEGRHVWLHFRCWGAWQQARRADAVAALAQMGISTPIQIGSMCGPAG